MQKLLQPYRQAPREAKTYRETENERFSTVIRRELLSLAAFPAGHGFFLSCSLACRTRSQPGDWHRRINPAFLTIMYIHSGTTLLRINDESWRTEAGDLVLIPPHSDSEFGTETAGERSGIILCGGMLEGIAAQCGGIYLRSDPRRIWEKRILSLCGGAKRSAREIAVECYSLLDELLQPTPGTGIPPELAEIQRKIRGNLDKPLPLNELAKEAGMNLSGMNRLFREYLKMPPHRYIREQRMRAAEEMLRLNALSVKETAAAAGYENALNFSTEFRKFYGYPPSAVRKRS